MTSRNDQCNNFAPQPLSRREMLKQSGVGFGSLALAGLLGEENRAAANPLAARLPHFAAKAKRVIFMFMHGGPSQVDTFDYKPLLQRDDGKPYSGKTPRIVSGKTGNLLASPWKFKQYGECGTHVSDLFPHVGALADDLCVVNSIHGSNSRHGAALLELHTGSDTFIRPSMGSWITYGLGSENQNLPGFITICPTLGHGGVNAWSSVFLPAHYQGTPIGTSGTPAEKARIPFIENKQVSRKLQRMELDLLSEVNSDHMARSGPDDALESRISSFELAFRMQREVPGLQDISSESKDTLAMYGIDQPKTKNFGLQCLMARRFCEAGVRFLQVTHSYKWDQHRDLKKRHTSNAMEVDKPMAGLIHDLKQRGLLEDTLVFWGGEFGRTPVSQSGRDGRDHNPHACSMFFAGGGVKTGIRYGATDDYGYYAVQDKMHFNDVHATILHLMGMDHERLTYKYAGRDFRLTNIAGRVVKDIIA
jgi:hypothetical protein